MKLSFRTFLELVQDMTAALQSSTVRLVDLSVGSVLRAILEANASIALWIQYLIAQLLQATRAATSSGTDLDSWMADFGLARLSSSVSVGHVVLSRYISLSRCLVPAGVRLKTTDGAQAFVVVSDTKNALWSVDDQAYVLNPGVNDATVPVRAELPGLSGNVQAGTITLLASTIPGIDAVINPGPLVGGAEAETDEALRARFQTYIGSRSRATRDAIAYAIGSLGQRLTYTIHENVDVAGANCIGSFVITVDDGTGVPASSLISTVYEAVEQVRPVGSRFAVRAPNVVTANVSIHVDPALGTTLAAIRLRLVEAISSYINQLPIGASLSVTRLAQVIYQAEVQVSNVSNISINSLTNDLSVDQRSVIKPGIIAVT